MKNICHNFYRTIIFNASALKPNMNPVFLIGWSTFVAWGALLDVAYTSLPMKRLPSAYKRG